MQRAVKLCSVNQWWVPMDQLAVAAHTQSLLSSSLQLCSLHNIWNLCFFYGNFFEDSAIKKKKKRRNPERLKGTSKEVGDMWSPWPKLLSVSHCNTPYTEWSLVTGGLWHHLIKVKVVGWFQPLDLNIFEKELWWQMMMWQDLEGPLSCEPVGPSPMAHILEG